MSTEDRHRVQPAVDELLFCVDANTSPTEMHEALLQHVDGCAECRDETERYCFLGLVFRGLLRALSEGPRRRLGIAHARWRYHRRCCPLCCAAHGRCATGGRFTHEVRAAERAWKLSVRERADAHRSGTK